TPGLPGDKDPPRGAVPPSERAFLLGVRTMRIGQQWEATAKDLWAEVAEVSPENDEERHDRINEFMDLLPDEQQLPFLLAFHRVQVRAFRRSLKALERDLDDLRLFNRRPEIQGGEEEPYDCDRLLLVRRETLDGLDVLEAKIRSIKQE